MNSSCILTLVPLVRPVEYIQTVHTNCVLCENVLGVFEFYLMGVQSVKCARHQKVFALEEKSKSSRWRKVDHNLFAFLISLFNLLCQKSNGLQTARLLKLLLYRVSARFTVYQQH